MKKSLIILLTILAIVSGCGKKEEKNNINSNSEVLNNKKEDTNITNKTDTDNKTNSNTTVTLGKNEYISLKDNKVHKYTFTYPDEATCVKNGDQEPYDVVYPVKPYALFGCEKVKDANGNILWGEYFLEQADENSVFYY